MTHESYRYSSPPFSASCLPGCFAARQAGKGSAVPPAAPKPAAAPAPAPAPPAPLSIPQTQVELPTPQPLDPAALATETAGSRRSRQPAAPPRSRRADPPPARPPARRRPPPLRRRSRRAPPCRKSSRPPRSKRLQEQAQGRRREVKQILDQLGRRTLTRRAARRGRHHPELPRRSPTRPKSTTICARQTPSPSAPRFSPRNCRVENNEYEQRRQAVADGLPRPQTGLPAGVLQPQPALSLRLHRQQRRAADSSRSEASCSRTRATRFRPRRNPPARSASPRDRWWWTCWRR